MNRRSFFGRLSAAVAGVLVMRPSSTYGYLDVDTCLARTGQPSYCARVWLNGVDVTKQFSIRACDDRRGYIETYTRDAQRQLVLDQHHQPVRERRYGHVRVTFV
jgi:hypothetical protein